MVDPDRLTLADMFRTAPGRSALFSVLPVALGGAQVANSLFTGLSLGVSVPFAAGMVALAALLTRYRFARFRRRYADGSVSLTRSLSD